MEKRRRLVFVYSILRRALNGLVPDSDINPGQEGPGGRGALARWAQQRKRSLIVAPATGRVDAGSVTEYVASLGADSAPARRLIEAVDGAMGSVSSLSTLTTPLALEYLDRLARPIPTLTPEIGVQIVGRAYVGHMVTEDDPQSVGATAVPLLNLPPLRRGHPPQDLLTRVVKASRRHFERTRAVPGPVWEGLVRDLARRAHERTPDVDPADLLALAVVDGLARFGWVLRQVDLRYGLEPDRG
jgi:hypothetical protein